MPEDMSWRSIASVASRTIKSYVAQRDPRKVVVVSTSEAPNNNNGPQTNTYGKQSWGQWAGQKIREIRQPNDEAAANAIEKLSLFPGWAARRYREPNTQNLDNAEFSIELSVSGFASRFSGPGFGTRSGRAFLRIAKSYASLPKVVNGIPTIVEGAEADRLARSAEELLAEKHLPPRPDEINEDNEMQVLEDSLRQLESETETEPAESSDSSQHSSTSSSRSHSPPEPSSMATSLQKWHANLEQRLYPFWATALANRTLRIAIYASDPTLYDSVMSPLFNGLDDDDDALHKRPIATREITTSADGSFSARFNLDWETICQHPGALHIAFGDPNMEHELFVTTQLMPPPSRPSTPTSIGPSSAQYFARPPRLVQPSVTATLSVPLTHTTIRVISDIDDTVKFSGILQGARAAFRNVFVKDLGDGIIPGMADWYIAMWKRGVRFHYVSNGPFELLPVVSEFIQLSRLPPGSVKLKSYAGRSLFNGLLSAPAERKRAGIVDVLESFPDSQFFLVGDSGEQDLELYTQLARDRPSQILAIFIRDANNSDVVKPLDDPTGEQVLRCSEDEMPIIVNGSGSGRGSLSVVIPRPGSVVSTPSSSPKLGDVSFTPRRPRSVAEATTPRAALRYIAPLRRPSRTQSEQISPTEATLIPVRNSSYDSNEGPVLPPPLPPFPLKSSSSSSGTPITDSPIAEEPGPLPAPTPSRPIPIVSQTGRPYSRTPSRSSTRGSMMGGQPPMSDAEKKQYDLQTRVYRARIDAPKHIPLRIFRSPSECGEAAKILDELHLRGAGNAAGATTTSS